MERSWLQNNINLRNKFLELTKKALTASVETYAPLGHSGLLPSDVVFNQLIYGAGTSEASSYSLMATKPWFLNKCPIGIFPGALTQPDAFFEQEVAHEMFHCFQGKNIFTWLNGRYSEQKWWLEGTAEYFANVVYPDANEEHTRTGDVDARTPTTSLFHMDYDNFLFFQHMGNEFSNEDILLTLGILPLSGDESVFAASLNGALPGEGADPFYHLFGEYYLDRTIHDTGSVVAPVNPQLGPLMGMGALGTDQYAARPYQPNWFRLSFPEKKKYSLSITTEGEGLYSTRPSGTRGNWGPLPDVIDTSCGAEEYTVLLTNVTPGSSYKFNIAVQNIVPKETCEHCLQGTWEIIPESFDAYMRSIISQVARLNSATVDNIFLTFDDETGLATFTWDNAIVDETKVGLSAENTQGTLVPDMQIVIKVEGTSTSGFDDVEGAIPGQGTITFGPAEGLLDVRIAINGNCQGSEPYNARDLNWTSAEQATYECIEDTLILTPVMPGLRVEPLRFQRMIPVPPPLP
jgi:hypothetical protein